MVYGFWPRAVSASWGLLAGVTVLAILAEVLGIPEWMRQLPPFAHLPMVPAEPVRWPPLFGLSLLACCLTAGGARGFMRRDIEVH